MVDIRLVFKTLCLGLLLVASQQIHARPLPPGLIGSSLMKVSHFNLPWNPMAASTVSQTFGH